MCCILLALFAFGPRLVLALEWIFGHRIQHAFAHWWWPLLGLIFLPFATLIYVILWQAGGLSGWDWFWVAFAALFDVGHWGASAAQRRAQTATA